MPCNFDVLPLEMKYTFLPTDAHLDDLACFGQGARGGNVSVCIVGQCFKFLPFDMKRTFLGTSDPRIIIDLRKIKRQMEQSYTQPAEILEPKDQIPEPKIYPSPDKLQ